LVSSKHDISPFIKSLGRYGSMNTVIAFSINYFSLCANPILGKPTMTMKSGQNAKHKPFLPVEENLAAYSINELNMRVVG
ncbi:MAG: hypothetical protein MUO22_07915, partial [Sedimentisphaerales bacterium]|nr:hypothetical protein [Sedimentisphaerales bacterium]